MNCNKTRSKGKKINIFIHCVMDFKSSCMFLIFNRFIAIFRRGKTPNGTFRRKLRSSLTMKREIRNASYRPFINNESILLTMSVSTYFEFFASLLMNWKAYVGTYLKRVLYFQSRNSSRIPNKEQS